MPWWGWLLTIAATLLVIWLTVFVVFVVVITRSHKVIEMQHEHLNRIFKQEDDRW